MTGGPVPHLKPDTAHRIRLLARNLAPSDEKRMERVCSLLKEVSGRLRVLLFTCHPERFRAAGLTGFDRECNDITCRGRALS